MLLPKKNYVQKNYLNEENIKIVRKLLNSVSLFIGSFSKFLKLTAQGNKKTKIYFITISKRQMFFNKTIGDGRFNTK